LSFICAPLFTRNSPFLALVITLGAPQMNSKANPLKGWLFCFTPKR
jgi:hypothetical protein